MTEPDSVEFHEHIGRTDGGPIGGRLGHSVPVRIGMVAGSALLVVIGAVAAMGASPTPSASTGTSATPDNGGTTSNGGTPSTSSDGSTWMMAGETGQDFDMRGSGIGPGFRLGGFRDITITAINGSSLSLKTDDGWTRTITVASTTKITRSGQSIALGDLKVGDQIVFGQTRATDGSYTIDQIQVVLPTIGGQVTAVGSDSITVSRKGGNSTATIHVSGATTYNLNGNASAKLSDITVGSFVVAEGTLRSDGSLDATAVRGLNAKGHDSGMPKFRSGPDGSNPEMHPTPTPTPSTSSSSS